LQARSPAPPAAVTETALAAESKITILYDAFGDDAAMKKDWGFSALVEVAGKRILFDTGNDRDIFAANVKAKNIDLTNLDFVVLSSLAVNTADGLVLLVSCSHPGIDKIVEAAAAIAPKIYLIAGGFHLVVAPDDTIAKTVAALKDTFKVENVAPGHCTGEPTFAALKQAFGIGKAHAQFTG
jgi:metal-dependent hydrolase (beta-lactamase superfamily II)